jgi:hypothetical protein
VRLGVEEREPPAVESSGGAEGERIAARECGEGIVAVGGLIRPGTGWQVVLADGLLSRRWYTRSHQVTGNGS